MPKKQAKLLSDDGGSEIKSPVFTPQPGWGGKLANWLKKTLRLRPSQFWAIVVWAIVILLYVK